MAMTHRLTVVLTAFEIVGNIVGYNISPVPNVIFTEPANHRNTPHVKKSYFGLAVHLTKSSVFIGAPRAITYSQRYNAVNNSGLIYQCDVSSGFCENYLQMEDRSFVNEILMSGQYFGATLDGLANEEVFVACAPRMTADENRYAMVGACYTRVNGTTYNQMQAFNYRKSTIAVDTALEGFAVRVFRRDDNQLGILTGMPGYNSTGSVIVYSGDLQTGMLVNSSQLEANGYFGYSVDSMLVENNTIYLVGAPRSGKVYVFQVEKVPRKAARMKIHSVLSSDSFGDYYGYSLCTEDINGDGIVDVMVGVPFLSRNSVSDHGAVFVYINRGFDSEGLVILEKQQSLESNYTGSGQFGYSISTLGDINRDGYSDIAVGAPFEGNGAIYIFHGGPTGIEVKPSQILRYPSQFPGLSMFGAAIAKAVDVDENGFNDIVIGAPNDETVYLYRTYPIVRPKVEMTLSKGFISIENATVPSGANSWIEDEISIEICYSYEYLEDRNANRAFDFRLELLLDFPFERAKVSKQSSFEATVQIAQQISCINLNASINASFRHLSIPVRFKLQYSIVNQNTTSQSFCEECTVQESDPKRPAQIEKRIIFKPNCEEQLCLTDLKLNGTFLNFESPFVINSSRTLELQYEISNAGESAYGTWLEINFSQNVSIVKTMDFCDIDTARLSCLINNGQALHQRMAVMVNVALDGTVLEGSLLEVEARLFSDGNETFGEDNLVFSQIDLVRHSLVGITGTYDPFYVNLDAQMNNVTTNIKFTLENYGPSNVREALVSFFIPMMFKQSQLIDLRADNLEILYKGKPLGWTESALTSLSMINQTKSPIKSYSSNEQFLIQKKGITLSCFSEYVICKNVSFLPDELPTMNELVRIELQLTAFPQAMIQLMPEEVETLAFHIAFDLGNPHNQVTLSTSGSLVFFRSVQIIPLWVYVASAVLGIAILTAITYALYKSNFFKRMTEADMEEKLTKGDAPPNVFADGSIMMI
ncbi:integrin alpha-PS5-like [Ochlerotatus camptorhynchus]|uniref:integrin alpha-PS5-like n=1 Tax=Ochlerotatus camptorhynchus TaxID=644619 RepID=UPI0031D7ED5B